VLIQAYSDPIDLPWIAVDQRVHRHAGPGRAERSLLAAELADTAA
jgi:hypothetical protein